LNVVSRLWRDSIRPSSRKLGGGVLTANTRKFRNSASAVLSTVGPAKADGAKSL